MSALSSIGTVTLKTPELDLSKIRMEADANVQAGIGVTGDPAHPLSVMVLGERERPVSANIATSIDLLNLPHLSVADIQRLMSVRLSLPGHHQLCLKVLGKELLSICMSGEGQAITQPYVPNPYERCEISACEEDTTPFPEPRG